MIGVGIGVTWLGYAALYYGITQIQGGNWGFLDLCLPSRWTPAVAGTIRDTGKAGAKAPAQSAQPLSGGGLGVVVAQRKGKGRPQVNVTFPIH